MRKSQWLVFGITFLLISGYLKIGESIYHRPPSDWAISQLDTLSGTRNFILDEIYLIAILVLNSMGIACFINAGLEWMNERKEKQQAKVMKE
jgi:hypothetical protein